MYFVPLTTININIYVQCMSVVVVMVDVTSKNKREHIHPQIMASLQQYSHIPSILVLNKVNQWYYNNAHEISKGNKLLKGGRDGERERGGMEGERERERNLERHAETIFIATVPSTFQGERERERERKEERERDELFI